MSLLKLKITNVILLCCFLFSRAVDYLSTYILVSLGAKEKNIVVDILIDKFGVVKGLSVSFSLSVIICFIMLFMIYKNDTEKFNLLMTLVLSVIVLVCLVVGVGNLSGLAYAVATVVAEK